MKHTTQQVTIAEPCSQNWEEMDQQNGFNFCQACNKCVVDFTGYSNADIIKTLAHSTDEVCGRLTQQQLDQLNYHLVIAPDNKNWMKYLGVLAIGISVFAQNVVAYPAKAEVKIERVNLLKKIDDVKKPLKVNKISGRVLDPEMKPLAGVKVGIVNTKYEAVTDRNGQYEIKLINGINAQNKTLSIQSIQFNGEITLNYSTEKQADLKLQIKPMIMGKIMYVPKKG